MKNSNSAAHYLEGSNLPNGWTVGKKIEKPIIQSGGYFSVCYMVEKDGRIAFLKALDIAAFFQLSNGMDLVDTMKTMTEAFQYERDLLLKCQGHHLSRIVSLYDSGQVRVGGNYFINDVPYLIFELAEGDYNDKIENFSNQLDIAWKLHSLHDVAVGLKQLHALEIAHLDLKPSNIFTYLNKVSKIGDLGRSLCNEIVSPHDESPFPGDKTYAPPEILYLHFLPDWHERVFSIDCYLLGSIICYYFLGTNMTSLLKMNMDSNFLWDRWRGSYDTVLPYLTNAFGEGLLALERNIGNQELKSEIRLLVNYLCQPNPLKRGHPKTIERDPNQFNLERVVTKLAVLSRKAEYRLLKNNYALVH